MLLAGLDIGTSGCKISVYNETGRFCGRFSREYPAYLTQSAHEMDANAIWDAVRAVFAEAAHTCPDIGAVGVTSFGETFVLLDGEDRVLCPSMLYTDPRGEEECAKLVDALGEQTLIETTGLRPHAMYSLPKLMWVRKHEPEIYRETRRVCLMEDFIIYRMTGAAQIDYSLATRTMAFDLHKLSWDEKILEAAGVDARLFPQPVPTGSTAGPLRPALAAEWGLGRNVTVVSASHDQVAAAIGGGVFEPGCAADGAGTVECITPVFEQFDARCMARSNYAIVPYPHGRYVCYAFSFTGGALVKWFADTLAGYTAAKACEQGKRIYSLLEDGWDGEPTGLLVLPHFAGAATPYMDPGSKGAILGLTIATTERDIHLAIMEGICFEMRLNLERLAQAGIVVNSLRATGGGANSRVWLQMKADILGLPVTALATEEAGAAGSVMLAGIAVGVFGDLAQAAQVMVSERETYRPRSGAHEKFSSVYERYRKLYPAVRPLM